MRSLLVAAALLPSAALSQVPSLPVGIRVRVKAPSVFEGSRVGTFRSYSGDTVHVATARERTDADSGVVRDLHIPWAQLQRLDVSSGKSRSAGAMRGLALGAIAGFVFGVGVTTIGDTGIAEDDPILVGVIGGAFAAIGGTASAAIGSFFPRDRWQRVHP